MKINEMNEAEIERHFDQLPYTPHDDAVFRAYAEIGSKPDSWGMDEAGNLVCSSSPKESAQ